MPFDFLTYEHYSINYIHLFDELNSKTILNNKLIQNKYLKRWLEILQNCDYAILNVLKTKESIRKVDSFLHAEPEIFQMPMEHQNNEILVHFRVSRANKLAMDENLRVQSIPINHFVEKNSCILWIPAQKNVALYAESKDPIVIVPFFNKHYRYLVIDGNHRLTYHTKNSSPSIKALILSEKTVIEYALFCSGFDKLYYIMNNELYYMANATHTKNTDALQLIQKSYLNNEKFNF